MLVVVHDGNVERLAQPPVDLETLGGLHVLDVDGPEGRGDGLYRADEGLGVAPVDLDVEGVDPGEYLEEHALALHDGFGGERTDVAQPQHRRAVRHDRHQVALAREAVRLLGIRGDGACRSRHAGRIGERQVVLRMVGFGRRNLDLARARPVVVAQRLFRESFFAIHDDPACWKGRRDPDVQLLFREPAGTSKERVAAA